MIRVCVLGSIGSGKTFISKLFSYPVFNADKVVSHLYKNDKNCFAKLKKKLPNFIKSFPIKKAELTNAISSSRNNIKVISAIVHPIVRKRMFKFLYQNKNSKIVVLDIPLLIENKLNKRGDILIFVKANKAKILKRVKKRKNYDKKIYDILKQNQSILLRKRKIAKYIIDNNFSPNIMKSKINILKKKILSERNST